MRARNWHAAAVGAAGDRLRRAAAGLINNYAVNVNGLVGDVIPEAHLSSWLRARALTHTTGCTNKTTSRVLSTGPVDKYRTHAALLGRATRRPVLAVRCTLSIFSEYPMNGVIGGGTTQIRFQSHRTCASVLPVGRCDGELSQSHRICASNPRIRRRLSLDPSSECI